jgi:arabinofuranosyltransferase
MNDTPRGASRRIACWVLMAAPVVALAALGWHRRWMGDDGFINLRVASNLLAGHGFVFNLGERVEAVTSPLWVLIVAALGGVGVGLEYAAVYGGFGLTLFGMCAALWGAWRLGARGREVAVPLGAVVYVALPPSWEYVTSGLETGLSLAWIGVGFAVTVALARSEGVPSLRQWLAAGVLLGLGPLVRPELSLLSAAWFVLLAPALWTRSLAGRPGRVAALFGAFGALPVAYQLFRMGYFAGIVPATALAKSAFDPSWEQGLHYLDDFFGRYHLWIPLLLVLVLTVAAAAPLVRRRAWMQVGALLVPGVCGALYCTYVVMVGGGFMHGRLFLPGLFAMIVPVAVVGVQAGRWGVMRGLAAVAVLVWGVACGGFIRHPVENEHWIGDERGWHARMAKQENPILLEDFSQFPFLRDGRRILAPADKACPGGALPRTGAAGHGCVRNVLVDFPRYGKLRDHRRTYPLNPKAVDEGVVMVVMRGAMGMIGFLLGPEVLLVDHRGLSDPVAARLEVVHRGRPGHEKGLSNAWLVGRYALPMSGEDRAVTAAREAVGCGELRELMEAISGPISPGRFATNLMNAARFHSVKVPSDPRAARARFCGLASRGR